MAQLHDEGLAKTLPSCDLHTCLQWASGQLSRDIFSNTKCL